MRSIIGLTVGAVMAITMLESGSVQSAPAFTTKYSYYSVSGKSTTGIFASLLKRLRRANGARHHAFTSIGISKPKIVRSAQGCSVGRLSVSFLILLPRLDNEASLPANDRRLWQQFSTFVRKHEETHRAMWMSCARTIETTIAGLKWQSCDEIARKAQHIVEQGKAVCRKKNAAFDAADRRRFDNHPFMRAALAPIYAAP